MTSYTAVFYIYTFKKSTVLKQVFCTIALVSLVLCYIFTEDDNEALFATLGKMFNNIFRDKSKDFILLNTFNKCSINGCRKHKKALFTDKVT